MSDDLPRADDPVPPGMVTESFLQRSATHGALVVTVGTILVPLVKALILGAPVSREDLAAGAEASIWAWLAAFGIHKMGPAGIRWK